MIEHVQTNQPVGVTRNYGIDALRLVLMGMISILHILGQGGVMEGCENGSIRFLIFQGFQIICFCSVDAFAMISGFTAVDKPQKYGKIIEMWFQVVFYSVAVTAVVMLLIPGAWRSRHLIGGFFPVALDRYWYFTQYVILFLAMPALNSILFRLKQDQARIAFVVLLVLFVGVNFVKESLRTYEGGSAIWLMVLYCLGSLMKRNSTFEEKPTGWLLLLLAVSVGVTMILVNRLHVGRMVSYISPAIVFNAMILVTVFSRLRFRDVRWIRKLSPLAFGIYLLQANPIIWEEVLKNRFSFLAKAPAGVLMVLLTAVGMCACGLAVDGFRAWIFRRIHLREISIKIAKGLGFLFLQINRFF